MSSGFLIKAVLGLAITLTLFFLLSRYVDLDQIGQLMASTRWPMYLVGLACWIGMYLVRTVRFVLLAPRTPYFTMLSIASVHNLLLRLLPMRTGELSYAFLVKRAGTAGIGESLLGLMMLRIIDATTVIGVFTVTLLLHQGVYLGDRRMGVLAAAAVAAGLALVVITLPRLLRAGLRVLNGACRVTRLARREKVRLVLGKIERSIETFSRIGPGVTLQVSGVSLVLWLLTFGAFFAIMQGFSLPVGFAQTVLGSTAAVVTGFLPVGGIGSFGTLEAGWALGFALVGLEQKRAVASGFGVSLTTFSYCVILGLLGWIGLSIIGKRKH